MTGSGAVRTIVGEFIRDASRGRSNRSRCYGHDPASDDELSAPAEVGGVFSD
jgi:hypothetical protein